MRFEKSFLRFWISRDSLPNEGPITAQHQRRELHTSGTKLAGTRSPPRRFRAADTRRKQVSNYCRSVPEKGFQCTHRCFSLSTIVSVDSSAFSVPIRFLLWAVRK
jgi:hypothetical protein